MSPDLLLTWFGGLIGARWNGDDRLHLLAHGSEAHDSILAGVTLCGIRQGLRPVTRREANRDGSWCPLCFERGQASRTPDLSMGGPQKASQGLLECSQQDVDESAGQRERAEGLERVAAAQAARAAELAEEAAAFRQQRDELP